MKKGRILYWAGKWLSLRTVTILFGPLPRMEDLNQLIDKLQTKVDVVIRHHLDSLEENRRLKGQIEELKAEIDVKSLTINQLEEQIENLKITVSSERVKETTDIKLKIDALIRELDQCAGMLNTGRKTDQPYE